jgi:mRNA-degrading endonuclease HigB of HigAB toxin-antitoxin module
MPTGLGSSHFVKIQALLEFARRAAEKSAAIAHHQPEEVVGGRTAAWNANGCSTAELVQNRKTGTMGKFGKCPAGIPTCDGVIVGKGDQKRIHTGFNIGGNDFRLITELFYNDRTVLVRHVLTHAEYDKEDWKK